MAKLTGANDFEKLKQLATKTYKEQAVWFLNAFWDEHQGEAEKLWNWVHKLEKLDIQKGKEGNEVDEMKAHVLLEFFKETMTVREMRDNLRDTGAIQGTVKLVPLVHLLIYRFKADWHVLVNASQGSNQKEIDEAQRLLEAVQAAFSEAEKKAGEARAALREAEAREAEAKAREAEAKASEARAKQAEKESHDAAAQAKSREDEARNSEQVAKQRETELKAAQEELQAALAELKAQEDAYNNRTNELTRISEDQSIGLVTRNKTKNELAQHLAQDPLPLRKAKITQEAAVKKADKATQAAQVARTAAENNRVSAEKARQVADNAARQSSEARAQAERQAQQASAARHSAEQAREASARAKEAADAAMEEAIVQVNQAEAYLEEVKSRPGSAHGAIWWIERELHDAKAYMPERKGGYRKPGAPPLATDAQ